GKALCFWQLRPHRIKRRASEEGHRLRIRQITKGRVEVANERHVITGGSTIFQPATQTLRLTTAFLLDALALARILQVNTAAQVHYHKCHRQRLRERYHQRWPAV